MNTIPIIETTDNFDPNEVDWEDDSPPGINLDHVDGDVLAAAVRAALNSAEDTYGWRFLDRDDVRNTKGRLYRTKYFVPEEHRSFFETNWPAYTFIWDSALKHHDHPVAHLATELNEIEMLEDWQGQDEQWIDLFGNTGRDKKYKRNCLVLIAYAIDKDYIRHQHRDKRCFDFNMEALCDPNTEFGKIKRISITHALYYLTIQDLGRILHTRPGRVVKALVHRHKETYGLLNKGEQEYRVAENGLVTQTNVVTGEKYVHPSLEAMFHQSSAKTAFGGITWSTRAAGGDSFIIEIVGCPNDVAADYVPLRQLKPQSWEEYEYSSIRVRKFLGWTWMTAQGLKGKVRIEDLDLFNKLRRYAACKQRTPRLKTEMANLARRLCNKEDIIAIHGGGASDIPIALMSDYVEVAMYVDVRHELDLAASMYKENHVMVNALNQYYEKGHLPADFTRLTKVVRKVGAAVVGAATCVASDVGRATLLATGTASPAMLFDPPTYTEIIGEAFGEALQVTHTAYIDGMGRMPGGW